MAKFLCNAFSLNMLASLNAQIRVQEITLGQAQVIAQGDGLISAVGHADTAAVFGEVLCHPVPMNRTTVSLVAGDAIMVGQYSGPRLPEGAAVLPEGASIKWALVIIS